MAKLDDFLAKKKEEAPILDLSRSMINSQEDFKRLLSKVPDFKIKPERVRAEDIKIKEKNFKFKTGKKDYKAMKEPYLFQDPIPPEMKNLKLDDLVSVTIDWHMLTNLRPKNRVDEEFFSRMVELGKQEVKTQEKEKQSLAFDSQIRRSKNKAGVVEMKVLSCLECGEDFCNGKACVKYSYDNFARVEVSPLKVNLKSNSVDSTKDPKKRKKKVKKRSRSKSKSRARARSKSKSPKKGDK